MEEDKKLKFKESFKKYLNASIETKDCEDACLKNGRADRYCLKCANEMMNPILATVKKEQTEQLILHGVSQRSELLAFEDWVNKNTTTALKDGIKLALENYKKANCG